MDRITQRTLGALYQGDNSCDFRVWAPYTKKMKLEVLPARENAYALEMEPEKEGYFFLNVKNIQPGCQYHFLFNNARYPDPASDYQAQGVFGPSTLVEKHPPKSWRPIPLEDYIIYELHVGTFSPEGTLRAIIPYLDELKNLGITAIELMPIAQFSGERNWGYDGVFPFAVQNSYGGPPGLKDLVNACHERNMALILDVVYNHLGPEGNYFKAFGPYFTQKYNTLWGDMLNYDDAHNHHVRRFFIENALHWFTEYEVDALRLDALHAIMDTSAYSFLEELADNVNALSKRKQRPYYLIAENSNNDLHLIRPKPQGGYGMHAQWNDDFHHALHTLLTHEKESYYQDFGEMAHLLKACKEGFVYSGNYSSFRQKPHGVSSKNIPASKFIIFIQNHDQIGNRALGERLTAMLNPEQIRLAAGLLFCLPYIPLIFMGEEYGETAPFQYFIHHQDKALIQAVREGRAREFGFDIAVLPDPQAKETFQKCKLRHDLKQRLPHKKHWLYVQKLIALRKSLPALNTLTKNTLRVQWQKKSAVLIVTRHKEKQKVIILANFSANLLSYTAMVEGQWEVLLHSYDREWTDNPFAIDRTKDLPAYGFIVLKEKNNDT